MLCSSDIQKYTTEGSRGFRFEDAVMNIRSCHDHNHVEDVVDYQKNTCHEINVSVSDRAKNHDSCHHESNIVLLSNAFVWVNKVEK